LTVLPEKAQPAAVTASHAINQLGLFVRTAKNMKPLILRSFTLALLVIWVAGCSTPIAKRLNRLELGMTQAQAKKILGDDYVVKASRTDASGATLQLWEFRDEKTEENYALYFKNGLLAQWGTPAKMDFPELNLPNR
jgi:hypothetical protein